MKKKTLILAVLVIGLLLPSCSNNSNDMMSSVIEKGLKRSIEQSEFMAASLMDQPDRLPKLQRKMELLLRQIRIGGVVVFFQELYGCFMKLLGMKR